jgi:hypothetical protein
MKVSSLVARNDMGVCMFRETAGARVSRRVSSLVCSRLVGVVFRGTWPVGQFESVALRGCTGGGGVLQPILSRYFYARGVSDLARLLPCIFSLKM